MLNLVRSLTIDHFVWRYVYMPLREKQYVADQLEALKEISGTPKIIETIF